MLLRIILNFNLFNDKLITKPFVIETFLKLLNQKLAWLDPVGQSSCIHIQNARVGNTNVNIHKRECGLR